MQAYYEIEADIPVNHELHIQLPDTIPVGRAKIAIIYELTDPKIPTKQILRTEFLNNLPANEQPRTLLDFLGAGKAYRRFSSAEEIDAFISDNREDWDNS